MWPSDEISHSCEFERPLPHMALGAEHPVHFGSVLRPPVEVNEVPEASPNEPGRKTRTRADLLNAVYESCKGLSRAQARDIFEMALDEISDALVRGEPVKLRSFGLFSVRAKRERIGRNPRTGIAAPIKPRRVLTFRASPVLVASINVGDSARRDRRN